MLRTLAGGGAGAAALGSYAFLIEPRLRLIVREHVVVLPSWGRRAPLRAALLADLHFNEPWTPAGRVRQFVDRTLTLNPDIIFLLGDYAPGLGHFRTRELTKEEWVPELSRLTAPLGVHAVFGNHDWWPGGAPYRAGLQEIGARVYLNDAEPVDWPGGRFWISGTDSTLATPLPEGGYRDQSDLGHVLSLLPPDEPALHLMHEPDLFVDIPPPIACAFAGHTHGGQVRIPGIGRPVVPSRYGQRFAYGHIQEGAKQMIVSGGLGMSMLPVRFLVPPEITLVTITGAR